jgi:hypothetical protein
MNGPTARTTHHITASGRYHPQTSAAHSKNVTVSLRDFYRTFTTSIAPSGILPSVTTGDALASPHGQPVVATGVGGNPEGIEDRVSGLLVPPGDLQALTQAICAVLQDKKRANRLGRAAKRRITELCSRERMAGRVPEPCG